jgi:hypothetical protein
MAETLRGFVLVVERRLVIPSTASVQSVEECLEDGHSIIFDSSGTLTDKLELADLGVDENVE